MEELGVQPRLTIKTSEEPKAIFPAHNQGAILTCSKACRNKYDQSIEYDILRQSIFLCSRKGWARLCETFIYVRIRVVALNRILETSSVSSLTL